MDKNGQTIGKNGRKANGIVNRSGTWNDGSWMLRMLHRYSLDIHYTYILSHPSQTTHTMVVFFTSGQYFQNMHPIQLIS